MENELRRQILRALIRDRVFLKHSWRDVDASAFPTKEEQLIAESALYFYEKYGAPIGALIRSTTEDAAIDKKFGTDAKKKLTDLLDLLQGTKMELVPVQALQDRIRTLKHASFYDKAVEKVLLAQEQNKLSPELLADLVEQANLTLRDQDTGAVDYLDDSELEKRIERRRLYSEMQFPKLMIPELDEQICGIGRGCTGLLLAPFNAGKGMGLIHFDIAYAMQGYNVLHLSLEDPRDLVEARLDASLTGIPMAKLHLLPKRLKNRFRKMRHNLHGKIRIIDGTAGGWSVNQVEKTWEQLKQEGFIADAIVIDYDEYLNSEKQFKGESARRFEYDDIYKSLRILASKLDVILWTAAQGTRGSEGKQWVTGKDVAEDLGKIRKVFLAIGIGRNPDIENGTCLYVCRHRLDRSRFGVTIMSDFASGLFYDAEASAKLRRMKLRRT